MRFKDYNPLAGSTGEADAGIEAFSAQPASPDIVFHSGVPCEIAAVMAAKDGTDVQKVNVSALQDRPRAQKQVVDFI